MMANRRWGIRLAAAAVWVLAALTWGSIAHHLLGLPDLGMGLAIVAVALVLALPESAAGTRRSSRSPALVEKGHPSWP
jgi:hypothetical protein